jgi:hypothetical protein
MDEKGFLLGILHKVRRLVPTADLQSGFTRGAVQDGSREFITLIACMSALGNTIPPTIIFKSQSGDLQNTWLEGFDYSEHEGYFSTSESGWTNHQIAITWLQHFHESTWPISGYQKRLLLLDGHSSHVSIEFLKLAVDYQILVMVFPPHTTHRLQPLDISIFSPLAHYYSDALDEHIRQSKGFSSMTKRLFWSLFWPSWQKATRFEVVSSAWAKAGIHPWHPDVVQVN